MARIELSGSDRAVIELAREALADAEELDMSDRRAVAKMLGRMEQVATSLLTIVDGGDV